MNSFLTIDFLSSFLNNMWVLYFDVHRVKTEGFRLMDVKINSYMHLPMQAVGGILKYISITKKNPVQLVSCKIMICMETSYL